MSQARQGTDNSMYGKTHTEQSKLLMSLVKTGKVHDNKTKKQSLWQMELRYICTQLA